MKSYKMIALGDVISQAENVRCRDNNYPILSMTMHNGVIFQDDKFKKIIASDDKSNYKVVYRNQLVVSFPIDEGVLAAQRITDAGIVSPAYSIWDIDQKAIVPEYLEKALRSERALQYYRANLRGSTARRRSLPTSTLLAFQIPLPSITEQTAILDLLHCVENIRNNYSMELEHLDLLIKARFVEMFGDPIRNPRGMKTSTLKELSELITKGASPSWQGFSYTDDESQTLFVTSENVRKGYIDLSTRKYLEDGFNNKQKRSLLHKGDFLINIVGASIGRAAQFQEQCKANINQAVALVRLKSEARICDEYLCTYLNSEKAQQMYNKMKSDTGRANLSLEDIGNLSILLPPLDEQIKYKQFFAQVDKSRFAA